MRYYIALLRAIAHLSGTLTLASGAAVVLPLRAARRILCGPVEDTRDFLAVRTDRPLTTSEIEFALELRSPRRRPAAPVPSWVPQLPIVQTTFGSRTDQLCDCRLGPDLNDGRARGVAPCYVHVRTGPAVVDV